MNRPQNGDSSRQPSTRLVLASGSATRLSLLRAASIAVEVWPAAIDEGVIKRSGQARGDVPGAVALELAAAKALAVGSGGDWVIGADQLLVCDGAWFDKPPDLAAARGHLLRLRGRPHTLQTAVVLVHDGRPVWRHLATPRLVMRAFSEAFLDWYLEQEGEAILASVGAYRLEGPGVQLFQSIQGEHAAILGLPMLPLLAALRRHRVLPD